MQVVGEVLVGMCVLACTPWGDFDPNIVCTLIAAVHERCDNMDLPNGGWQVSNTLKYGTEL